MTPTQRGCFDGHVTSRSQGLFVSGPIWQKALGTRLWLFETTPAMGWWNSCVSNLQKYILNAWDGISRIIGGCLIPFCHWGISLIWESMWAFLRKNRLLLTLDGVFLENERIVGKDTQDFLTEMPLAMVVIECPLSRVSMSNEYHAKYVPLCNTTACSEISKIS